MLKIPSTKKISTASPNSPRKPRTASYAATTNNERLSQGIKKHAGNAIIIKVNQVGTLTDATDTLENAQRHGYTNVVSHRSGDTTDWHIAHLAVAYKCPLIKTGVVEGARTAKLNELLRIEHFLGNRARMADLKLT